MLGQDPTSAYMQVLEQEFDRSQPRSSEDLNLGTHYVRKTVQELLPELESNDVENIVVDPGAPGQWERVYPSPHNA